MWTVTAASGGLNGCVRAGGNERLVLFSGEMRWDRAGGGGTHSHTHVECETHHSSKARLTEF